MRVRNWPSSSLSKTRSTLIFWWFQEAELRFATRIVQLDAASSLRKLKREHIRYTFGLILRLCIVEALLITKPLLTDKLCLTNWFDDINFDAEGWSLCRLYAVKLVIKETVTLNRFNILSLLTIKSNNLNSNFYFYFFLILKLNFWKKNVNSRADFLFFTHDILRIHSKLWKYNNFWKYKIFHSFEIWLELSKRKYTKDPLNEEISVYNNLSRLLGTYHDIF